MRKLFSLAIIGLCLIHIGWTSESGGGVVSDTGNILRASIEATAVLQSDVLARLYGETRLGGAVNYASFDSGGVFSTRNVVSSKDPIHMANNQFIQWEWRDGGAVPVGLSSDNIFYIPLDLNVGSDTTVEGDLIVNGSFSSTGTDPGGSTDNVQFNESGSFGGDDEFLYNTTLKNMSVGSQASTDEVLTSVNHFTQIGGYTFVTGESLVVANEFDSATGSQVGIWARVSADPSTTSATTRKATAGVFEMAMKDSNSNAYTALSGAIGAIHHDGTGTVTDSYGLESLTIIDTGATVTNQYGIRIQSDVDGTATNQYGLYIDNPDNSGGSNTLKTGLTIENQEQGSGSLSANIQSLSNKDDWDEGINAFQGAMQVGVIQTTQPAILLIRADAWNVAGAGTVSTTGTGLTGVGTAFSTGTSADEPTKGDVIKIGNEFRQITAVATTTSATLDRPLGKDVSGATYQYIKPMIRGDFDTGIYDGTPQFFLNALGNMGIGTQTPQGKLEVYLNDFKATNTTNQYEPIGIKVSSEALTVSEGTVMQNARINQFWNVTLNGVAGGHLEVVSSAATVYVASAPTVGTNIEITSTYAIWVDGGAVRFDDELQVLDTATGGNAGTDLCVDKDGYVCACGSCA